MTTKLYFTMGCPRSGKSSYSTEWANAEKNRVVVCSDDIRLALHGNRYEPLAETMVFAIKHVMIRALLNRGFTVMVDGTHSTEISIMRLLEIDPNAVAIIFDTSKETCIERAKATGQEDLIPAIERIEANLKRLGWQPEGSSIPNGINENLVKILIKVKERNLYRKNECQEL